MLKIAKKGVFTPKIAKKWIFERGAQKIFKNEGQIRVQHEKICQNSEVPELYGNFIPTLKFLPLSSLTIIAEDQRGKLSALSRTGRLDLDNATL